MLAAAITPFFVFSAFLLLLLVSLSAPVTKTIYILRLTANIASSFLNTSANAVARFGVWGYCISSINVSIAGLSGSDTTETCSQKKLGYDFDSTLQAALRADGVNPDALSATVTAVLVLHPITCGITFLMLLSAIYVVVKRAAGIPRPAAITTFALGLVNALLTTVLFIFDVVFVVVGRSHIKDKTDGTVTGSFGNGVWMVLGAAIAVWGGLVGITVALFRSRSTKRF